ncbi:hypothetical protein BAUCODRAFT_30829 [Baudoinia panamericana UAMH 10762]|uniref:Uncharacterized protein n=1 Tax=Baudoinia panamericana (strain UAMH 10762) TaxID=717646 RepID=M2M038_BAUPA|nr:uncharacterized protein BAUCODRAFT_30829 [Baudoinia panamericana UAMH 10762]EMD00348.1 hypothetical protein BAUCODRAFT_30829 [Baudoinia panamericana UAMH 10762]
MERTMLSRTAQRTIPRCSRAASSRADFLARQSAPARIAAASHQDKAYRKQQQLLRSILAIAIAGGVATLTQHYLNDGMLRVAHAEAPPKDEENALVFEASRKKAGLSKEENRDLISSQHHQVKRSWENPGVYAWGSNSGRVAAPDSTENVIKTPRRINFFDGMLLRDIKLDRNAGAAIDEKGNLLQWGTAYAPDTKSPATTLQGKDLVALSMSRDRVLALSRSGKVYSLPMSAEDQAAGIKPSESTWLPFWTTPSPVSYRLIAPKDLKSPEKVTSIDGGLEHALLLTSQGRVFSTASSSDSFPTRGQLGIPGLTFLTRPEGPYDQPHEITTLRGFSIAKIACGDYHSLALDRDGRVFSWGDNSSGQLGFDFNAESSIVDAPSLIPTQKLYSGTSQVPSITSIAAGGSNSYITVDATKVAAQTGRLLTEDEAKANRGLGRVTADTFAFGAGIYGGLGNSRWTHVQPSPIKIPSLSGLFEYDERTNTTVPIRLAHLSVGATHAAAVMRNITHTSASTDLTSSDDSTNWGADIVFWGGNEHYQLGTGRRNNMSSPTYLQPLDMEAEIKRAKRSTGGKEEHRFHITPRATAVLGDGRRVSVEQRVECGRGVTAVYSGT